MVKSDLYKAGRVWHLDVWEVRGAGVLFVRRQFSKRPGRISYLVALAIGHIKIKLT